MPFLWVATIALSLTGLVYFATTTFYSDSEIWPLSLSTHLWSEIWRSSVHLKLSTHFLLWMSSLPASSDLEVYFWARVFFALNGVAIWWLSFKITDVVFSRQAAWCTGLLLALSPTFTNQIFRLRADCISVTFFLCTALVLIKAISQKERRIPRLAYWTAIALILATPKSAYFLLALFPLWRLFPERPRLPLWAWGLTLGALGLILTTVYHEAISHFLAHFRSSVAIPSYFSSASFVYLFRVVKIDPLILFGAVASLFWRRQQMPIQTAMRISLLITLATVIFHNEKLPFFLGSRIPVFAIGAGVVVDRLFHFLQPSIRRWVQIALSLILFSFFCQFHAAHQWTNSNDEQQVAILRLGELMEQHYPQARYWDAIGILPSQQPLFHFLGPGSLENNINSLSYAQKEAPEFVFLTNKFEFVLPETHAWLATDYISLGHGIYGRSAKVWESNSKEHDGILDASEWTAILKGLDPKAERGLLTIKSEASRLTLVAVTYRDGRHEYHHKGEHQIELHSGISSIRIHGQHTDVRLTPFFLRGPSQLYTGGLSMSHLFRFDPHSI